jgi:transcriptional regulator with XRE-family HTH domain
LNLSNAHQIEYLLQPPIAEQHDALSLKAVGWQFKDLRKAVGLTVEQVVKESGIMLPRISDIETGWEGIDYRVAKFTDYLEYAKFLGTTIEDIFINALNTAYITPDERRYQRALTLSTDVQNAIRYLQLHNRNITSYTVAGHLGIGQSALFKNPQLKAIVSRYIVKRRRYK